MKPEITFPPKYNSGGQRANCEECDADLLIGDTVKPSLCRNCFGQLPASVRKLLLGSGKVLCEPGSFEWMEAHARNIRDAKGPEYTVGSSNRLDNFDLVARQLNLTPEQVLSVFTYKHWTSVLSYCANPDRKMSEPIENRIADMINYLLLLYLMVHRRNDQNRTSS